MTQAELANAACDTYLTVPLFTRSELRDKFVQYGCDMVVACILTRKFYNNYRATC